MAEKITPGEGYAEALKRIEAYRQKMSGTLDLGGLGLVALPVTIGQLKGYRLKALGLSSNRLTELPPEIGGLRGLTELYLRDNQLSSLPPEIGGLEALKELNLSRNHIMTLPPEIGQLTGLTTLDLSGNRLSTLPREIGQLTALRALDLSGNQLSTLPREIGQLTALTRLLLQANQLAALPPEIGRLTSLMELSLNINQLTALPPEIGWLTALLELYLQDNQLTRLPAEIGQLTRLIDLALNHNHLTTLPPQIGQLTALTKLSFSRNELTTVPGEIGQLMTLRTLWLDNNQLTTLPAEIRQLTGLQELFLHGNPALALPDSILGPTWEETIGAAKKTAARPSDILNFYFTRRTAAAGTLRPLNEIKVMLVGRGGAGKTSLRRFFMNQPHDRQERETAGIALDSFPLRSRQGEITVRLWDFAGQEITHALHQFFLTEGCVYVLVLDPRSNTEGRDAEYWLNLLKRYAGSAPVLVAMNKQDLRQGGYDVDRNALRERFPSIQDFVPTNCETREGCQDLRQALQAAIDTLNENEPPQLKVPESWLKVKEECFEQRHGKAPPTTTRQHLTLEEFRQLCAKHGVEEEAKQESLARLLHQLGVVLHFVDEPRLRDTTVLNPHWVTDGVYRLLRARDWPGSDGILTLADALTALPSETEKTARFLLRLMERFEMCFPLDEKAGDKSASKWLVPGALNPFQPAGIGPEWQQADRVRLRYQYDPLPEGVLPRFIVLTHLLSEGQPRWRYGVVLEDAGARALVRKTRENVVEVTALGPEKERLRLLEIVQGNLERIHADLPKPRPVAEVELAGFPETFRLVGDLKAAEVRKKPLVVETELESAEVEAASELNRLSEPKARDGSRSPLNVFLSYSHEDKKAKDIFRTNLTVMEQKRFITPWHDGLIEPGMLWKEEIEENLEKMDVFVGLLTTAFLASQFIQTVELKAAREKLRAKGVDFLFVLILVDDIPLKGLDLAEYQILKPGGKAVSKHKSRKEGFNVAQRELEELFEKRGKQKAGPGSDRQPR